jgi:hypothetical protein
MGPADAVGSFSFSDLDTLRQAGTLTAIQADIFITPRPVEELYDCESDPDQLLNVASAPGYQKRLLELRYILKDWMEETGDNIPEDLTKDWYERVPGYVKTEHFNIRGEAVDKKYNSTGTNNSGRF